MKMNPFAIKHSDFKYLFYDSDMKRIHLIAKELFDLVKNMQNRYVHKESTQIAKSVFNYVERKDMLYTNPQCFYDFRFGDSRICIAPEYCRELSVHHYYLQFHNYKPDFLHNRYLASLLKHYDYCADGRFGNFVNLSDAIKEFQEFVNDCIAQIQCRFNFD